MGYLYSDPDGWDYDHGHECCDNECQNCEDLEKQRSLTRRQLEKVVKVLFGRKRFKKDEFISALDDVCVHFGIGLEMEDDLIQELIEYKEAL